MRTPSSSLLLQLPPEKLLALPIGIDAFIIRAGCRFRWLRMRRQAFVVLQLQRWQRDDQNRQIAAIIGATPRMLSLLPEEVRLWFPETREAELRLALGGLRRISVSRRLWGWRCAGHDF